MCVPDSLIPQLLKIQDYSVICAPHISQIAATAVLRHQPDYALQFHSSFDSRRRVLTDRLQQSNRFSVYEGAGACFLWCRPRNGVDSTHAALGLLNEEAVSVIPGSMFGDRWSSWIRLSYGRQNEDRLIAAAERMARFFS
jgi:aminotransferase